MSHDPLCKREPSWICDCEVIAETRRDERKRFLDRIIDRMTDTDLDDLVQDDAKDLLWRAFQTLRDQS